jgi:hypothetical protein
MEKLVGSKCCIANQIGRQRVLMSDELVMSDVLLLYAAG